MGDAGRYSWMRLGFMGGGITPFVEQFIVASSAPGDRSSMTAESWRLWARQLVFTLIDLIAP